MGTREDLPRLPRRSIARPLSLALLLSLAACGEQQAPPPGGHPLVQQPDAQVSQQQQQQQDPDGVPQQTCPPQGKLPYEEGYCTAQCPCEAGYGGCAADDGCKGDLVCSTTTQAGTRRCVAAPADSSAGKKAAGAACAAASECASGTCDCSAQSPSRKQCLAASTAAVACTADKKVYWQACAADDECTAGRCACWASSSTQKVCLPAIVSATTCEGKKVTYDGCARDEQCPASRCACSTPSPALRQCLPDTTVSKACQQADGSPCESDAECASASCGCVGGAAQRVCLPAGAAPSACSPRPDWEPCTGAGDCLSGVCNRCYSDTLRCLPAPLAQDACLGQPAPATPRPSWQICGDHAQCASGRCACTSSFPQELRCVPAGGAVPEVTCSAAKADGLTCAAGSECQSGLCDRCYSESKLCLPASYATQECLGKAPGVAALIVDWQGCSAGTQCQSGVCGCSVAYPSDPRCLPSSTLQVTCGSATSNGSCVKLQTTVSLNIRAGAGLEHAVLGTAPAGATVEILGGPQSCWYQLRYCNVVGWSYSNADGCATKYAGGTWINPAFPASCGTMSCN